jgi:hypothetical protein
MKCILFILLCCYCLALRAQDSIKLNFLYGSKPAKGYKKSEAKHFGGLKGGHVNIEANGRVLDFLPGNCPIFPQNKKPTGGYYINSHISWDTSITKCMSITIPVTALQLRQLENLFDSFSKKTPYDYAVFGMRCAAASYDVLSKTGLVKKMSQQKNIVKHFYPKLLRKRMLRWAATHHYPVIVHDGRPSRKWESDKGVF